MESLWAPYKKCSPTHKLHESGFFFLECFFLCKSQAANSFPVWVGVLIIITNRHECLQQFINIKLSAPDDAPR
jgi:hypothetical protein